MYARLYMSMPGARRAKRFAALFEHCELLFYKAAG